MERVSVSQLRDEVEVQTARSSGPGGQHVNKVETKVILRFNIDSSEHLSDIQKEIIKAAHRNKITKDGDLLVTAESKRSQLKNKELAFKKLDKLLAQAFSKKKTRKPTAPSKAAKQKRLASKRLHSEKKQLRQRPLDS